MSDDAPFGSLHVHWHPTEPPDVLTAAIARVRAMFGLDTPAKFDATRAVERTESTHMMSETLTPVSAPYAPVEPLNTLHDGDYRTWRAEFDAMFPVGTRPALRREPRTRYHAAVRMEARRRNVREDRAALAQRMMEAA